MSRTYTIGQLAKAGGVPVTTLRFYERAGLVAPEARTGSNYRTYGDSSLRRLRFIKIAQASGMSLSDIASLIDLTERHVTPCAEVQSILRRRIVEIEKQLAQLAEVKEAVESALQACCRAPSGGLCSDLGKLSSTG